MNDNREVDAIFERQWQDPSQSSSSSSRGAQQQKQQQRSFALRSRRSNRLFQANRLASDLVSCLSEFCASRNVINRPERYEKIRSEQQQQSNKLSPRHAAAAAAAATVTIIDLRQQRLVEQAPAISNTNNSLTSSCCQKSRMTTSSSNSTSLFKRAPIKVKKFNQSQDHQHHHHQCQINNSATTRSCLQRGDTKKSKRDVNKLLGDLLSGRHESRLLLVGRLLRAPIVLAAPLQHEPRAESLHPLHTQLSPLQQSRNNDDDALTLASSAR